MLDLLLTPEWVSALLAGKKGHQAIFRSTENDQLVVVTIHNGAVTFSIPAAKRKDAVVDVEQALADAAVGSTAWRREGDRYLSTTSGETGFFAHCKLAANQCGWYDIKAISITHAG